VYDERRLPAGKGGSSAHLHQALKVSGALLQQIGSRYGYACTAVTGLQKLL
jgi:hypothetical protein